MANITGTPGDDSLVGTTGDDTINALAGNDVVNGLAGNDTIDGGDDHDLLNGQQGDDTIYGGNGDDLIRAGTGNDYVDGGSGIDRISYASVGSDNLASGVTVSLALQGTWQNTGGGGIDYLTGFEHLTGTRFSDTLTGDGGDNWLWGGFDPATGLNGDDTISGGGGNDLIQIAYGNSTVDGGTGTDTLTFFGDDLGVPTGVAFDLALQGTTQATSFGSVTAINFENLSGTIFDDTLSGDGNANVIAGDQGSDTLSGGAGDDTLYGDGAITVDTHNLGYSGPIVTIADVATVDPSAADGNDILEGGLGDDNIYGGGGADTASYAHASGAVQVFLTNSGNGGSEGADGFDNLFSIENLIGSAYSDQLFGNNGDNVLSGGDGNDLLFGRGGNDTLLGGNGDDFFRNGVGNDVISGGAGFDRMSNYGSGLTTGVHVDLNLQGAPQDTGHGMDTLTGIEALSGTDFDDTLIGDDNMNWLLAADGNDTLIGNGGNDLLDVLDGELGPASGNHVIDGGTGNDTVGFNGVIVDPDGVTVSLALQGGAQDSGHGMLTLSNIENLSGSQHDDVLTGDGNDNTLSGHAGNDTLAGGAGNDMLYGDGALVADTTAGGGGSGPITFFSDVTAYDPALVDGNDLLEGGAGNDHLDGGGGVDTASYEHSAGAVEVNLQFGFADEYAADGVTYLSTDTLVNIEDVVGSEFDDTLVGNNGVNTLVGLGGNDLIIGNAGDDTINGGDGNDTLRGDQGNNGGVAGNDTLYGSEGNDFLNGGFGNDLLDGGSGFDRATFYSGATAGVHVDLNLQGVAQNTGQGMDTLVGIENISGTAFGDTLIGDGGDNWLWGSPATLGDGSISAANNDTLDGGGGNDLLMVGVGNHSLTGGTGIDTLAFTENGNPEPGLTISLELQGVAQVTGAGSWTLNGIENLSGGIANDHLTGDGNDNVLAGDTGNDNLVGGAGNDTLYGDGRIGIDYAGGPGTSGPIATFAEVTSVDPTLVDGNDTLEGGLGDDNLYGGGGSDTASYAHAGGDVQAALYNGGFGEAFGADGYDQLYNIENLTGGAFNDQLTGNNDANVLSGGDGHDALRGRGGNDTLLGGNGDDFLNGGAGDDTIDGGAGYDRATYYTGATAGVTVNLNIVGPQATGQGNDTLIGIENVSGTAFNDVLTGDVGDNWLWGSPATLGDGSISAANNDTLDGGGGNDLLTVGIGNHSLTGGTGIDTVAFTENGNPEPGLTISLALQGVAQVTGGGSWTLNGIENLSGGVGNDNLTGDSWNNVLAGDIGNDNLVGGAGDDTLYGDGRIGTDSHGVGTSGPITTWADATTVDPSVIDGNDTLEGGLGNDTLNGGGGTDTASYAHASDSVFVNLGTGTASGADGNDTLVSIENVIGSAYDDALLGSSGDNVMSGGDGNDNIRSLGGNDTLNGEGGHDIMRGGDGNDTMSGGDGDDYLAGDAGDDYMDGGNGFDRVSYAVGATTGVTVSLAIIGAQATGAGMDTLVNIEHLTGTKFSDTLTGNGGDNWIWGGSDGTGITGNDTINAGGGNDLVEVGAGNHTLNGGTGNDTLSLYGNSTDITAAGITFDLTLQGAAQNTEQGMMNATGFENVSGSIYDDNITGDAGANILLGDLGNDVIRGGDGADHLYGDGEMLVDNHGVGSSGPITLFGDASLLDPTYVGGNDTLLGGKGDDWLYGGRGNDTLTGNQGADHYVIETNSGNDHVTDFAPGVDKVLFDAISGVDDFGDLTITKVGNSTVITWGTSDSLTIDGLKPNQLHASDFEFGGASFAATNQVVSQDPLNGSGYDHNSVADALGMGSTFHSSLDAFGSDAIDHGMAMLAMQSHI